MLGGGGRHAGEHARQVAAAGVEAARAHRTEQSLLGAPDGAQHGSADAAARRLLDALPEIASRFDEKSTKSAAPPSAAYYALAAVPDVELFTAPCPLFVDFVEAGVTGGPDLEAIAHDYLEPLRLAAVDTLILGCTHYPLLSGVINYSLGDSVTLVSSADECAKSTWATLNERGLLHHAPRQAGREFLTTGNPQRFQGIGSRLMGGFVGEVAGVW